MSLKQRFYCASTSGRHIIASNFKSSVSQKVFKTRAKRETRASHKRERKIRIRNELFLWNKRRWKFLNFCGLEENIWISFPVITFDVQLILDWHKRRKLLWYKRQQNIIFRSVNYRSLSGSSCLGCNLLRFARADFFSRIAKRDIFHSNIRLDSLQKILPNWLVLYKSVFHMSSILVKYNFRLSLQLSEKQLYHFRTKKTSASSENQSQ